MPGKYDLLLSQAGNLISPSSAKAYLEVFSGKQVSIIVPVYNALNETENCIKSVLDYTTIPFELILINDASPDERIQTMLDRFKVHECIRVISNPENLGFVKTVNLGMKQAKGDVVLLNSDTAVTPRWLQKLMIAAYSDSKIATVTPFSNAAGAFSVPEVGRNDDIVP